LRDAKASFDALGANIAAIGLGGMEYARHFREDTKIDFPLLVDEDNQVHKAAGLGKANILHVFRRDNAGARKRASFAGFRQYKLGKNPFQLGGSFVFGPGNVDHFAHVSATFGDNASMKDILAAVPKP
jgi:hypothetical protein